VECAFAAGEALNNHPSILVQQNAHTLLNLPYRIETAD
jgi:hypothetical protein